MHIPMYFAGLSDDLLCLTVINYTCKIVVGLAFNYLPSDDNFSIFSHLLSHIVYCICQLSHILYCILPLSHFSLVLATFSTSLVYLRSLSPSHIALFCFSNFITFYLNFHQLSHFILRRFHTFSLTLYIVLHFFFWVQQTFS